MPIIRGGSVITNSHGWRNLRAPGIRNLTEPGKLGASGGKAEGREVISHR